MPESFFKLCSMCLIPMLLVGCLSSSDTEDVAAQTDELKRTLEGTSALSGQNGTYSIDNDLSALYWSCGDDAGVLQSGSFKFAGSSNFKIFDGAIRSGQVNIDINSLQIQYLPDWASKQLATELLSPLFLDGKKYPFAQATVYPTKEVNDELMMPINLFLSGQKRNITLPIQLEFIAEDRLLIQGKTTLDRRDFGINHRTPGSITEGGDDAESEIDSDVEINIEVTASIITE